MNRMKIKMMRSLLLHSFAVTSVGQITDSFPEVLTKARAYVCTGYITQPQNTS